MPATLRINPVLTVTISGNDPKEIFKGSSFWMREWPKKCGSCGSDLLLPLHRKASGFDFYEAVCMAPTCGHSMQFGQQKADGSLFPKREWKPPFQRDGEQSHQPTSNAPEVDDSDIAY